MEELITTKELAAKLKITTRTIYNWIDDGMPVVKIGYSNRYELEKVMNWLSKRSEKNKGE